MALTLRNIIVTSIPTLAAIFGLLWFTRKKKQNALKDKPKEEAVVKPKEDVVVKPKEGVAVKPKEADVKPKEGDVRPKENLDPNKKEQPVLSVSDIVSDQPPLGTSTMLNTAMMADGSKSVQKSLDKSPASAALKQKTEIVNKDDSLPLTSQTPLATSTPINLQSAQQTTALNNNKKHAEPVEKKTEADVEKKIEAKVQSTAFAKPPVDEEIGQGDRSRSSDVQFRGQIHTDSALFEVSQAVPNDVSVLDFRSTSPESERDTAAIVSEMKSDTAQLNFKENDNKTDAVACGCKDNGASDSVGTDSNEVKLSEPQALRSDISQPVKENQESSMPVSPENCATGGDEVPEENNGNDAELSEVSPANSPSQTPTNGMNGSHSDAQSEVRYLVECI